MATRTNPTDVKQIIESESLTLTDSEIQAYISDANVLVTDLLTNSGLSSALMKSIEKWLTAHMIVSTRMRMAAKEGAGGASITYTGVYGEGLKSTPYGQHVIALDTTGAFASLMLKRASITAVET